MFHRHIPWQLWSDIPSDRLIEGGLVVDRVTNQREGRAIVQGDVVVGQMEEKDPWITEGNIKEVCAGDRCFLWRMLYGIHRTSS